MPFTLAHPALMLPLEKYWKHISFTAAVAGSMAPDVEFFLHLRVIKQNVGHHFEGIFFFDLPVAIGLCLIFQLLIKDVLIFNLPRFLQVRLGAYRGASASMFAIKNVPVLIYSALLGIASHLFWDAFTHNDGFFVQLYTPLSATWMVGQFQVKVYAFLQLLCSVIGLIVIFFYLYKKPVSPVNSITETEKGKFWLSIMIFFIAMMALRILAMPNYLSPLDLVMAVMGIGFLAMLLTCMLFAKQQEKLLRDDSRFNKFI